MLDVEEEEAGREARRTSFWGEGELSRLGRKKEGGRGEG